MKLCELSEGYLQAASALRAQLRTLRKRLQAEADAGERESLRHRIASLTTILTQCTELADLTAHYYERGYTRNEKYTLS